MELKKKKPKQKYQINILGFSCDTLKSMKQKPTIRQLVILREIIKIWQWGKMEHFTTRGKRYVWINYKLLFSSIEWLGLSRVTLSKDITKLIRLNLIDIYEENKLGKSRIFFIVTELSKSLYLGGTKY